MLSRISDALNLQRLRTGEWLGDLSPFSKALFTARTSHYVQRRAWVDLKKEIWDRDQYLIPVDHTGGDTHWVLLGIWSPCGAQFNDVLFSILAEVEQIPHRNLRTLVPCFRWLEEDHSRMDHAPEFESPAKTVSP
jgi:hypothetical protein